MKEILGKLFNFSLFFVIFSFIVNLIFLIIIAKMDWDFNKRLQSLTFGNPDYEVLCFGSSFSEYAFDTELMTNSGIKSFNLGLVGNSIRTVYIQLNEYLNAYPQKPKTILLGINSFLSEDEYDEVGIQPVVEFTMKGHKYTIKDIPITKFNWAGMELLKRVVMPEYRKTEVMYGQKRSIRIISDDSQSNYTLLGINKIESSYWMNQIAALCAKSEINFLIVDLPGINETQNLSPVGPFTINYPDGSGALLFNLNSREFCQIVLNPSKDWAGLSHLNKYGAEKFTREMIKIIFKDVIVDSK